jgi:hypothetical protein
MKVFQIILIPALIFLLIAYLKRLRRAAFDKIFIFLLAIIGIVFVIDPEMTNKIAHFLGVGRGADLIFYLAILGFSYLIIILYSKIKKLEERLADLVRSQALNEFKQQ